MALERLFDFEGKVSGVVVSEGASDEEFDLGVDAFEAAGADGIEAVVEDSFLGRTDRKSTRLNSSHVTVSRMPSSA